ncbi:unnamed protein product [Caenorhabditis sp. 36 PRJEB53466]|nr:unnamed protein product [Caenorhabditis sp. 36 PRJEB53466]
MSSDSSGNCLQNLLLLWTSSAPHRYSIGMPSASSSSSSSSSAHRGSTARLADNIELEHLEESEDEEPGEPEQEPVAVISRQPISGTYNRLTPDKLFDLTTISEVARSEAGGRNLGVTRLTFSGGHFVFCVANRDVDNDETRIEMVITKDESFGNSLRKAFTLFKAKFQTNGPNVRRFAGVDYYVRKNSKKEIEYSFEGDGRQRRFVRYRKQLAILTETVDAAYRDLLKHIFQIFPNETPLLFLDLRGLDVHGFSISRDLLSVEQIRLSQSMAMTVTSKEFVGTAHIVLELMGSLEALMLDIKLSDVEFFNPRMCSVDHLTGKYNGNKLSHDNLCSLECKTIKLWNVAVTPSTLNSFVKNWLAGTSTRFHYLEIPILQIDETDESFIDIFKGLKTKPWSKTTRAGWFKRIDWNFQFDLPSGGRFINCKGGWDVFRSDGLVATIITQPEFFYFFVWHERFPEQPDHIPYLDREQAAQRVGVHL